jgi:hypothetical protein
MELLTQLIITWNDGEYLNTQTMMIENATICGDIIGIMYDNLYKQFEDSMMQCVETLIPAYSPTPTIRNF